MIFRRFGNKEALFDAAVLTPFTEFLTRHLAEWAQREPGSLPAVEEAERLFNQLIGLFVEERSVVLPLLAVYHFDDASAALKGRLEAAMRDVVALVEARTVGEATTRGYTGFDTSALARIMVGVCFSLVTFPRLFDMDRIPRTRFVQEMARLTMHGVEFRNLPLKEDLTHSPGPIVLSTSAGSDHKVRQRLPRRVTDDAWAAIAPLLSTAGAKRQPGRRPIDDRAALEGIIDVLASGRSWKGLPRTRFGVSGITCWRRLRSWQDHGVWDRIFDILRSKGVDMPDAITPTGGAKH
jgi:transposase